MIEGNLSIEHKKPQITSTYQQICYRRRCTNCLEREGINNRSIKRTNVSTLEFSNRKTKLLISSSSSIGQVASTIKSTSEIRRLCIDWVYDSNHKFNAHHHSFLHQSLKDLRSLQILKLDIQNESNAGLLYFCQSLKRFTSLQNLSLSIVGSFLDFTDLGLNYLRKGIKKLSVLKRLDFSLLFTRKITDLGLQYLSQGLRKLTSLEEVSLEIHICTRISDIGVSYLSESLGGLWQLKSFNLNMSHSNAITDKSLASLSKSLKTYTSLQSLVLIFQYCLLIGDEGLRSLNSALKKHICLKHLEMNLSGCADITDEAVRDFSEGLLDLVSLRSLEFNVSDCSEVTEKEFAFMIETLKKKQESSKIFVSLCFSADLKFSGVLPERDLLKKCQDLHEEIRVCVLQGEKEEAEEMKEVEK